MIRAIGVVLTIAFLAASFVGTVGSGWIVGDVAAPARPELVAAFPSPRAYLMGLAVLAESLRLTLSLQAERFWRSSRFQGAAFAVPLWLVCTAYCTLVPLMTLATVHVTTSSMLTILGLGWLFIQIAAGLLPGIAWPAATRQGIASDVATDAADSEVPALPGMHAFPAGLVPRPVASAGDFLQMLTHLADMPEGSKLAAHGRIDANGEIVMSQGALAALVGRSKPTVRRWLQDLENQQLILRSAAGKATRIRVQPNLHAANGDARH
ncbi:MAG: hypothetical protein ACKVP3_04820 [Hyphomicrobiaceae bacterium]